MEDRVRRMNQRFESIEDDVAKLGESIGPLEQVVKQTEEMTQTQGKLDAQLKILAEGTSKKSESLAAQVKALTASLESLDAAVKSLGQQMEKLAKSTINRDDLAGLEAEIEGLLKLVTQLEKPASE